eukprot:756055-Hanusia_phi.AAC.1
MDRRGLKKGRRAGTGAAGAGAAGAGAGAGAGEGAGAVASGEGGRKKQALVGGPKEETKEAFVIGPVL